MFIASHLLLLYTKMRSFGVRFDLFPAFWLQGIHRNTTDSDQLRLRWTFWVLGLEIILNISKPILEMEIQEKKTHLLYFYI